MRFGWSKPRYDQGTYLGRLRHFSEITDPRNLLATDSQLNAAKELLANYKGRAVNADEEALWKAKKLIDSNFHSDTGEKILLPFRMACFVPTNALIVAGMLVPNPSIVSILFWQWVNQSVNVAFNYCNANKTTQMDMGETVFAYGTAVASSCTIAVGLNEYVKRTKRFSPSTLKMMGRGVPFVAVAAAGTLNVFLMRSKEITEGISVFNDKGETVGKSQSAGWSAISQVAVSRVATAFPAVFLPSVIMSQLEKTKFLKANPRLHAPLNLLTICGSLMAALPCAIALFPQIAEVSVDNLEPQFRQLRGADGERIKTLYFNRGL
ncbi:Tricarboxylate/iron carrier [Obelidium mucronatum]|nr:Tricarboxylate/iron carrier [Obelidium mucronatum]